MKNSKRLKVIAVIAAAVICLLALSAWATASLKSDEILIPSNSIILQVPTFEGEMDIIKFLPAETLLQDTSDINYKNILNRSYEYNKVDYKHTKKINVEDYSTLEDMFVEVFLNILEEGEETHMGIPVAWFAGYENCDFSTVNAERLAFKCELLAQQRGMSTYGNIYFSGDSVSYNVRKMEG